METTAGKFMRAVVRMRSGTDVAVHDDVRVPVPGKGEVLIRVRAAALNPIDFKMPQLLCGQVPGQDVAGVVEACGPETVAFSVGDEVFGFASRSNGSLAEFCIADVTKLARKPLELSFESAAAMPVAYLTGYQALIGNAGLKKGDAVIVLGASGGCGTAGVQLAARLGAREVVGVCSKGNAELVLQLGATRCVDYADADAYAALARDGRFDVIYDCASGNGAGADYSADTERMLAPGGRAVALNGSAARWLRLLFRWQEPSDKLMLARQNGADLAGLVAALPGLSPVVGRVLQLSTEEVSEGYALLRSRRARGKVVVAVGAAAGEMPEWSGREQAAVARGVSNSPKGRAIYPSSP